MKIKVSTATGPALDWMVAKCEGALFPLGNVVLDQKQLLITIGGNTDEDEFVIYAPTTNWAQGGPIIEREKIDIFHQDNGFSGAIEMATRKNPHPTPYYGETDLVAAMRTYVASKLGEEVDVPEELT